jgi:hypothetical protein
MQAEKDSLARAEQKANDPYMNHLLSEKKNTDSFPRSKQASKTRIKEQVKQGKQKSKPIKGLKRSINSLIIIQKKYMNSKIAETVITPPLGGGGKRVRGCMLLLILN